LHNYIVKVLNDGTLNWGVNIEMLNYFLSFFGLLKNLLLRKFFDEPYNDFMMNELKNFDASKVSGLSRKLVEYNEVLPRYIGIQKSDKMKYQNFYLLLKFNLIQKLQMCKPQYFEETAQKALISNIRVILFLSERNICYFST